jgi:hypothetical protein
VVQEISRSRKAQRARKKHTAIAAQFKASTGDGGKDERCDGWSDGDENDDV